MSQSQPSSASAISVKPCILYARSAVADENGENSSIPRQLSNNRALTDRFGLTAIDEVVDVPASALDMERSGLQTIISVCKKSEDVVIVVESLDRLFRSAADHERFNKLVPNAKIIARDNPDGQRLLEELLIGGFGANKPS